MRRISRILLSVVLVSTAVVSVAVDWNASHIFNPDWPAHAKFHDVVMLWLLSAIALHQTAYGLVLVSAFSFGLAVVLIAIGLTVVYAHKRLSNLPSIKPLQRFAPVVSASAIIIAGSVVTVCAVI